MADKDGNRQLTLAEKWAIDGCMYQIKGDALHCGIYTKERKPKPVLFGHEKCPKYREEK